MGFGECKPPKRLALGMRRSPVKLITLFGERIHEMELQLSKRRLDLAAKLGSDLGSKARQKPVSFPEAFNMLSLKPVFSKNGEGFGGEVYRCVFAN